MSNGNPKSQSEELRSVNLHIIKDDWCKKLVKHYPKEMICAGVFGQHGIGENYGLIGGSDQGSAWDGTSCSKHFRLPKL